MDHKYKISVIMAVYNAEPFLKEAVDSLIAQDIGFENIQLIMVDDGSTDNSPAICDEYAQMYPDNVFPVHKENGGVASARNEGLKYAEGKYLNFMDSDDKFELDAFKKMYDFFEEHEEETDMVTVPLQFFDAMEGAHWGNKKFKQGSRVIDLVKEPTNSLMFVNATLFSSKIKDKIVFDSSLPCGEDIKVIYTLLISKMTMGVVASTCYWYRRRSVGGASLIATAHAKKSWYFDYFYNLQFWVLDYYKKKLGYIPNYVKYVFASETQWRFRNDSNNIVQRNVLNEADYEKYKELLRLSMQEIDDNLLINQPFLYLEQKLFLLLFKYNASKVQLIDYNNSYLIGYNDCMVGNLSSCLVEICLVSEDNGILKVEGLVTLPNIGYEYEFGYKVLDTYYPAKWLPYEKDEKVLDKPILTKRAFALEINLNDIDNDLYFKLAIMVNGKIIELSNLRYRPTSAISNLHENIFLSTKEYIIYAEKYWISVVKANEKQKKEKKKLFRKELFRDRKNSASLKAWFMRGFAIPLFSKLKRKPIWLISDRYTKAGDNGEAFFAFMQNKKEIDSYFILFDTSVDYDRLKATGKVVEPYSWKHKILHLLSDVIISAHADDFVTNPLRGNAPFYRDMLASKKFVFLQHGIIKADISDWYNRLKINASVFVTSAIPEYNSINDERYLYDKEQVSLTGLPRYDLLEDNREKIISIMPTWRAYLVENIGDGSGDRKVKSGFDKSSYYKMYMELLNNEVLLEAVQEHGYKLQWITHPNMKDTLKEFNFNETVEMVSLNKEYKNIFAESALLITDYSSVAFDMAYLRKPVIYYQYDNDEFFSGAHTTQKGYFDDERDGFGEVEVTTEDLVHRIIEYMENDCKLKDLYRERIDKFYAFSDKNNCQRVYDKIINLN